MSNPNRGNRTNPGIVGGAAGAYVQTIERPDKSTIGPGGNQLHAGQAANIQTRTGNDPQNASAASPLGPGIAKPLNES